MRKLKLDQNNIQELVAKTIEQLQAGTKNITLNVNALLNLPTPKPLEKPEVRFSLEAYHKMQALVNYCDKEICWHGLVEKVDDLSYYVYDILVYPQLATAATVEADEEEYVKWLDELEDEEFNAIRMQGHSHVNMTASPSGVDEDYYDVLRRHITDYYIYLIMNKSGKMDRVTAVVEKVFGINAKLTEATPEQLEQLFESVQLMEEEAVKAGVEYGN